MPQRTAFAPGRRRFLYGVAALVLCGCGARAEAPASQPPAQPTVAAPTQAMQPTATGIQENSMIRYTRSGGRTPPRDREILEIADDGSFSLWRSVSNASYPPSPIGRFAGNLDDTMLAEVRQAAESARAAGDWQHKPPPDAAIETIDVGGAKARLGANDDPEGAWTDLIERLRELLGTLTEQPRAALAIEVAPDGQTARLVQQGNEPLRLDLSSLAVRAVLWEGYSKKGDWQAEKPGASLGTVSAAPGWTLDLPFEHGFQPSSGQVVIAYVTCTAFDGDEAVPVSLDSPRP